MPSGTLAPASPSTQTGDAEYWQRLFDMQPASVTVVRKSQQDIKQRQLVVWLDGEKLGDLMFGDTFTRDVQPGPHKLRVSNTLVWKTVQFDVKPGEQVRWEAINRPGRMTYPLMVIIGVGPIYLTLRRVA